MSPSSDLWQPFQRVPQSPRSAVIGVHGYDPANAVISIPLVKKIRQVTRTGGADILQAKVRVTFWGALAMALTAGIGKLVGIVG